MIRWFFAFAVIAIVSGISVRANAATVQNLRQLDYATLRADELGLPKDLPIPNPNFAPAREIPGRKIPELLAITDLNSPQLAEKSVPLPKANTLAQSHFQKRRFGRVQRIDTGAIQIFNPQILLVKFRNAPHVAALRVAENSEVESLGILAARNDVEFAELDSIQQRQFTPNDSQATNQWHHTRIGSFDAWEKNLGTKSVRIAIVDTPFQMNHPDLAANTIAGWDVVDDQPVTSSSGIAHSTLGAGLAAAVINNGLGVAGAGNCSILPININGAISEMYNAVIWAADHGVRIVNISWTGADSASLNEAGLYLRNKTDGVLAMPGVNGTGFLDYPNQPYIICVSMTDAADNMRSRFGNHIDFAAPGYDIFSTSVASSYASDSGTSYSTPLFCGVLGVIFSINPALSADDALEILKNTAVDKGQPGWDQFYGWGRIDFAAAASAAQNTLPKISNISRNPGEITIPLNTNFVYSLWKSTNLINWSRASEFSIETNSATIVLRETNPGNASNMFYRVRLD